MRLNAYLARAGVASRRGADELIKAGRVTVNGEPGQLNTFVAERATASSSTASRVELQPLAYVLLHKPAGVVTTARDPQGRPHRRRARRPPGARRPGRPPRRRHDRRAPAHERRRARAPARAPALRGREGLRGRGRGRARPTRRSSGSAAGIELDDGPTAPARARRLGPGRVELTHPRRPQAPGQADARGRRPPGHAPAPQPLRGADPRRARARRSGASSSPPKWRGLGR